MPASEIEPIVAKEPTWLPAGMSSADLFSHNVGRAGRALDYHRSLPANPTDEMKRSLDADLKFEGTGWNFTAGDPEFFRYKDMLLVPGGKMLDIGIGYGRSAMYFALNGMNVVGYDNDPIAAQSMRGFTQSFDFLPIEIREADALEEDLGTEEYDTVMLSMAMIHLKDKDQGQLMIDKAVKALKPGGHIYIRSYSDQGFEYNDLKVNASLYPYQIIQKDRYTFLTEHGHGHSHGHGEPETVLFFDPLEIPGYLIESGMRIRNTRVIPSPEVSNTMFGEDAKSNQYTPEELYYTGVSQYEDEQVYGGMFTVIAQKPLAQIEAVA